MSRLELEFASKIFRGEGLHSAHFAFVKEATAVGVEVNDVVGTPLLRSPAGAWITGQTINVDGAGCYGPDRTLGRVAPASRSSTALKAERVPGATGASVTK